MKATKRKWGYYNVLLKGKGWWLKKLTFKDASTSYQSHKLRDEIWTIYVPAGCKHKIGGKGDVLEFALGEPKEKDIIRYKKCPK
jgi:mannose-6-phosphate isomerase-like protein (cupin superfamily)